MALALAICVRPSISWSLWGVGAPGSCQGQFVSDTRLVRSELAGTPGSYEVMCIHGVDTHTSTGPLNDASAVYHCGWSPIGIWGLSRFGAFPGVSGPHPRKPSSTLKPFFPIPAAIAPRFAVIALHDAGASLELI